MDSPSTNNSFPAAAYESAFVEQLLLRIYEKGQVPTREENAFFLSLKSHPTAVGLAISLLHPTKSFPVQQFAANLLIQVFETPKPELYTDEIYNGIVSVISEYCRFYAHDFSNVAGVKIRRQLMTAVGLEIRPLPNWKTKFHEIVTLIEPDFFQSVYPNPVALDVFYIFMKFGLRKFGPSVGAFDLVLEYFTNLLRRHYEIFDEKQAIYLRFLGEWLRDVEEFGSPTAEVGKLMVQVAKFVDSPERQQLPWSAVQMEAANTLEVFLALTDLHLLQISIMELLNVIVSYPVIGRSQSLPADQTILYLNTVVNVFLHYTLEFADVVIACADSPTTEPLLLDFTAKLRLLVDPFPDRPVSMPSCDTFARKALTAFSELSSFLFQMCGSGSGVADSLMAQLKSFFQVLLKKAQQPAKTTVSAWSQEEQESYREMRLDIKQAVEHLSLAVGNDVYEWINEEFVSTFRNLSLKGDQATKGTVAAICWVFRFAYSSKAPDSQSFRSILGQMQNVFLIDDRDCVFQAFKALEIWLPALQECGYEDTLTVFVPVIVGALSQKEPALTNMCAGSLAALIETLARRILPSYMQLSGVIEANLTGGVGSLAARETLTKCLGHLMAKLPPDQATAELERILSPFTNMMGGCKTIKELATVIGLLPGFFLAFGADIVEIQLTIHAATYQAVSRLGARLLTHLQAGGILDLENATLGKLDDACCKLIKSILYACGPAGKELLPAVVPLVGRFFARNPTAAVLDLIAELLTVHLDGIEFDDLFNQLCMYVFTSVVDLSKRENWEDFVDVYAAFSLTAYPVIRGRASTLVRMPLDWEAFLNFVIKLLILLPISGDAESTVQSNLILEEMLRMKPRDSSNTSDFVNPIKILMENSYGVKLVQEFLKTFYTTSSDNPRVRMLSDCLFVMLTEMNAPTKFWLKQVPSPVVDSDSVQHAAYDRLLSSIITQRIMERMEVPLYPIGGFFNEVLKPDPYVIQLIQPQMEHRRNSLDKSGLDTGGFVADIKFPGDLPLPHDLCQKGAPGHRKSIDGNTSLTADVISHDKITRKPDQIVSLGPVEGADRADSMHGFQKDLTLGAGRAHRPSHVVHQTSQILDTDIEVLDTIPEVSEKRGVVNRVVESVAAAAGTVAGTVAGIFSSSKSTEDMSTDARLQTEGISSEVLAQEGESEKGLVDTALEKVWNVLTGKEDLFPDAQPAANEAMDQADAAQAELQNFQYSPHHTQLNADAPVFVPHASVQALPQQQSTMTADPWALQQQTLSGQGASQFNNSAVPPAHRP